MSHARFITVAEAQLLLLKSHSRATPEKRVLTKAVNSFTCSDIYSPLNLPPFNQSSVDGYAFRSSDLAHTQQFRVVGESAAGSAFTGSVGSGEAVRIMTGARVPDDCECLIMQEDCKEHSGRVHILQQPSQARQHLRLQGSQLKQGELALRKGTHLQPAALGLVASMGFTKVSVYARPRVCVITNGDELQRGGRALRASQVYESNATALNAALQANGLKVHSHIHCKDDPEELLSAVQSALDVAEYVLVCGGVSVGKYDYVPNVLRSAKVREVFYKVQQRPGKPLLYGRKGTQHLFALPGNPASVLCCFYEYVLPSLRTYMGDDQPFLPSLRVRLAHTMKKNTKLQHFVRAQTDMKTVWALEGQESYKMKSFAEANCLLVLNANTHKFKTGDEVEVHLLSSDFRINRPESYG